MKPTFKQFNQYVSLSDEELTEEKLDEIFGKFFNKAVDAVTKTAQQKREEEIKKKLAAKRNDLQKKQEELKKQKAFAAAKAAAEVDKYARQTRSAAHPMSAAGARAGEREWIAGMAG